MNSKFDELTKSMAQSVTRRAALKKFGVDLAGMVLACFGLANRAEANKSTCAPYGSPCTTDAACCSGLCGSGGTCWCVSEQDCKGNPRRTRFCYLGQCGGSPA
jgi:hypothetical protein